MGIKHFSIFMNNHFKKYIYNIQPNKKLSGVNTKIHIDNLMIDMNGIFHSSAQKIYKYGSHKPNQRLLKTKHTSTHKNVNKTEQERLMFHDVCLTIEHLMEITQPSKRVVLSVDGPAPLSKQNQQRQRRFKNAKENTTSSFDSTCITPGTLFMDSLTSYIDWYIHAHMKKWNVDIIFSDEKVPGEGEHKLMNYIRSYGNKDESYCICGLDADLIMLALGTHFEHMYVLRDDIYNDNIDYMCIDIKGVREVIIDYMRWDTSSSSYTFNEQMAINDFIFLCFMTGNDFLPNVPSIEIIQDGIEQIIKLYNEITAYGHITTYKDGHLTFNQIPLGIFFYILGTYEKENIDKKINKRTFTFPDTLLNSCVEYDRNGKKQVHIKTYQNKYNDKHFKSINLQQVCHSYLEGMQWVISYYINGNPNWKWFYPYHYAPFASSLSKHCCTFKRPIYKESEPTTPFQQLLCVLPPSSSYLLPKPLATLLSSETSPLKKYCPDTFDIDLSGKRKEWEGTVILPMVDFSTVKSCYNKYINQICYNDMNRDKLGKSYLYCIKQKPYVFESNKYGNINQCIVHKEMIHI